MIVCDQIALTAEKAKELRAWLDRPGLNIMLDVAEAAVKYHEALALNYAVEGVQHARRIDTKEDEIALALRYQTFVDVLNEFVKAPEFKTTKLT